MIDEEVYDRMTTFHPAGTDQWPDASEEQWRDYRWQLKNRISSLSALESRMELSQEERAGVLLAGHKLAMSITPHFFQLIDRNDPDCPIRRQVIPRIEEAPPRTCVGAFRGEGGEGHRQK
jgi:lysine 2,3-aminomutase